MPIGMSREEEARIMGNGHFGENPLLTGRVDLGEAIRHGIAPPAELQPDILLKGKIHHLFGASETGKTIIALWLIMQRIADHEHVVYFDQENGQRTIAERLAQMGADPELVSEYLVYLPFPSLGMSNRDRKHFRELLDEVQPSLILFDSWASFLSSSGLSEDSNQEIEDWDGCITKEAKSCGIASVILDHTPHEHERSRGASRKKEVADVQWRVKKTLDFDRDSVGTVLLIRTKDREGWLPETVTFSVGGNRFGKLTCCRSEGTYDDTTTSTDGLTTKERVVYQALKDEYPNGASSWQWQRSCEARNVGRATYFRARQKLVSKSSLKGVSETPLVSKVNETYFATGSYSPRGSDETAGSGIGKGKSQESHPVSKESHETETDPTDSASLTRVPPLKGGTDETNRETAANSYPSVEAFFANPPAWLAKQLRIYRRDPDRHLKPLCSAVAAVVLGDGKRGDEVKQEVMKRVQKEARGDA